MAKSEAQHKVIFDTDPGVDDAMAILMMAGHPDIDIVAFTTSFGNVSTGMATRNGVYLSDMIAPVVGKTIPVYKGVHKPFMYNTTDGYAEFVHGKGGLGGLPVPDLNIPNHGLTAAEFIVKTVRENPGEITLVPVAPLGNIALAMMLEPELPKLCKDIFIMGGSFYAGGNTTPIAEANIYNDPHAADMVFAGDWADNSAVAGLDITYSTPMSRGYIENLGETGTLAGWMADCADFYIDFYASVFDGEQAVHCHDAVAVGMMTNPELFETISGAVRVQTDGMLRGQTVMDNHGKDHAGEHWNRPSIQAGVKIDADGFRDLFADCIKRLS